jgi:enoyl-CoA hydratase/carnithine racemase
VSGSFNHLKVEDRAGVALVRIDRPPANAMDPELLEEGHRCLTELGADQPGAVVITGTEEFFSGGVDLKLAPTLDDEGQREMVNGINRLFAGWYTFPRPVVCAVNGHAIAGGLILALCGDHRVGSPNGKLGLTELRVGIPYPAVAIAIVRAELTPAAARELVLRAELVTPEDGLRLGLLDEIAARDSVLERSMEVATELARLPTAAYAQVKEQLRHDTGARVREIVAEESDPLLGGWIGDEGRGSARKVLTE